jgi:hypothetical protein
MILLDFVTANGPIFFGAIVFDLRFKIDIVVMIIWSFVIIINFVLTL